MRLNSHHKVTLTLSTIVAVILTAVYFYLDNTLKTYTYKRIKTVLEQEISLAKVYLEKFPSGTDFDPIADDLGKRLVSRVTIIGPDGAVLGDSMFEKNQLPELENHLFRPEIKQALKEGLGQSRRYSLSVREDMLYVAALFGDKQSPRIIRVALSLAEISAISVHLQKFLWFSLWLAFIFALLVSHFASLWITRPVARISSVAQAIASGDFSQRVTLNQNDEIADLAKAVEFMSQQIQSRMEEVTQAKSRLEAVFLSMAEGVMVVNSDGKILLMNDTLRNILHVEHQAQGRKPLEVIRNIQVQEIVDEVLGSRQRVNACQLTFLLPEEKILRVSAAPILLDANVDGAVLVFHDITDLRRLEVIRKDFVANVSHEFRTPTANIKGYAETLLDGALNDKEHAAEFLKIIHCEAERLAKLVDDLLVLARHESGKPSLNLPPASVTKTLDFVLTTLNIQIKQRQIKVISKIPPVISPVKVDESSLAQVFLNIIENAIKYNKIGGEVHILASEKPDCVEITVTDNGLGIEADDLPRIFERFYRVDKAHSREIGGTGLGLSIVKHIIQAHGGEITATSRLGEGSSFRFTLPKA